jgi:hypothetical protein
MFRAFLPSLVLVLAGFFVSMQSDPLGRPPATDDFRQLKSFPVVEFRRYTIKEHEREHFAEYFDAFFPEAFEQLGCLALGTFADRGNPAVFLWIRGFHSMDDRASINSAFYSGPLWKEHKATMNKMIEDSDNVLLLQALTPDTAIEVLPAVDPVAEGKSAKGIVVTQIFAVKADNVDAFARQAETVFAGYRAAGAHQAGILVTADVKNNFPHLPVRTDGPFLVWIGVVKNDRAWSEGLQPVVQRGAQSLSATGLLRGAPELLVLEPTRRSRLRWLDENR